MAVSQAYLSYFNDRAIGDIDWNSHTFKCMLVTAAYSFVNTHTKRSSITNEVPASGGYVAGGVALTGIVLSTVGAPTNEVRIDFDDINFGASTTITASGAVIYRDTGLGAASDPLVAYIGFGSPQSSVNTPFIIVLPATGFEAMKQVAG